MRAVESREGGLQRGRVLLSEGRERRERVGDAEERRAVAVKFEVRCALRDELVIIISWAVPMERMRAYRSGILVEKHCGVKMCGARLDLNVLRSSGLWK